MDPRLTFKVNVSFRDIEQGAIITQADCPDADFPWLVKVGTITPISAGPLPLMSSGVDKEQLLDEVERLTGDNEPLVKQNAALLKHVQGMHAATEAALKIASDRGKRLIDACVENGNLMAQVEEHKAAARKAQVEADTHRRELEALRAQPPVGTAPPTSPGPTQSVGEPPNEAAGPKQPQVVPAPNETEASTGRTVKGKK